MAQDKRQEEARQKLAKEEKAKRELAEKERAGKLKISSAQLKKTVDAQVGEKKTREERKNNRSCEYSLASIH